MFKKPKRNFRSRRQDSGSDEEANAAQNEEKNVDSPMQVDEPSYEQDEGATLVPKKIKKKKKDEPTIHRSSSALSFEHEEEGDGEVFQIKKSSHSRRVAKQLKKESRREKEERERREKEERERQEKESQRNNQISNANEYSTENLKKMKAEQDKENGHAEDVMMGSDADISDFDDEDDDTRNGKDSAQPSFKDILSSGQIPDAAMIHMARKKRQQAREQGDDFLPLDDAERVDKSKSRLIREDDNDKSDDDEDERIDFSVNSKEKERRHIQTTILAAEEESHSEGSEHEEAWVQQQIRKGVQIGGQLAQTTDDQYNSVGNTTTGYPQFLFGQTPGYSSAGGTGYGEAKSKPGAGMSMPKDIKDISMDQIRKRLQDRLLELSSVHRVHTHELDELDSRLEACQSNTQTFQEQTRSLEEQYRFFQEMRGYVRDLVECLNEKMSSIVFLERCMNTLLKQRTEKLVKRRQEDIKDQSVLLSAAKAAAGPSLASQDTSAGDGDPTVQRRAAERDGRRNRRRRAREAQSITDHNDGLSTDDEESKSETTKFTLERDRISRDASTMFEDVMDDFCEFRHIKSRFESWKRQQRDSYEEAYIGLCLPKLFTPLVRLKLIDWNPLEPGSIEFEEMNWYETLMFYGYQEDEDQNLTPSHDADQKLMPNLVERVVLPKLIGVVESVWDPLSSQQTRSLVATVTKLVRDYPSMSTENKNTQALVKAVVTRLKRSLDEDVFVPLYPKQVLENKNSPAAAFFHRQFWSGVKLLRTMVAWEGLLSQRAVQELALDSLLNRYLVLALHSSPINPDLMSKCHAVTSALPQSWFSDLEGDSTLPQLQNLARILVMIATMLDKQGATANETIRRDARDNIKQITRMLVTIHALDQAASLADQFSFKI